MKDILEIGAFVFLSFCAIISIALFELHLSGVDDLTAIISVLF